MNILHRKDTSNRLTTRRALDGDGNRKHRRKSLSALALSGLLFAGGAAAYFAVEGIGSGNTSVNTGTPSGTVTVTVTGETPTELGGGSLLITPQASAVNGAAETATWQLSAPTTATITNLSVFLVSSGGDVVDSSGPVTGCLASWFMTGTPGAYNPATPGTPIATPFQLTSATPLDVSATVWLQESGTNQSACESLTGVEVNLQVS